MKPNDVKINIYFHFDVENNDKDRKLKVGDHVQILKYKNILAKRYTPNCSNESFVIKMDIFNRKPFGEEIVRTVDENELQKTNERVLRI